MKIKAVRATETNFKKFGLCYNLYATSKQKSGDGWRCSTSDYDFEYNLPFGYVEVNNRLPHEVVCMKRNSRSKEMQFIGSRPIVLAVADSKGDAPSAPDVEAFILYPGDVIVMGINIWHDASCGLYDGTYYYYQALDDASAAFVAFKDGEKVLVT